MKFDDEIDEMDIYRRMMSRKDKLDLANEYIKAIICDDLSISGFENPNFCNLNVLPDALKTYNFVISLELGDDEPTITIRKQGRKRRRLRWIDRR